MKKLMTLLLAGMMLLGMVTVAKASTTISYISNATFSSFGKSDIAVATVGQTFRLSAENAGDDNLLDSVTFWIRVSTGDIKFKFYLYDWDGSKITGDPLFESGELSTGQQAGNPEFTVDVGGVELNVDQDYVFFVSASDFLDGSIREGYVVAVIYQFDSFLCSVFGIFCDEDRDPDHTLVYNNNGADFSLLSSTAWSENTSFDMAFTMVLSASEPKPEPKPELSATFELGKAKVDLKKGKIKVDGQVILPEGVTCEKLDPVGSLKLDLFKLDESVERVVDESVALEVKGRKAEKWHYKNRHALGVTEYKVHWKDDQTGTVKIKADFDPGLVDLSRLTPTLVAEFTPGDLGFELTMAENGQYDCKLKKNKWDFRNKRKKRNKP